MSEDTKKDEKKNDFGEGIEVVKDSPHEDKDIEINFGKILSFFKKKPGEKAQAKAAEVKSESKHHAPQPKHEKDEETEIDLGKVASGITGVFKGKKEDAAKTPEESSDDVAINLQAAGTFLKRWGMPLLVVMGLLLSIWLTVDVRLQPEKLPFANEWAANSVYGTIQSDVQNAINTQYPNLPEDRKSQILSSELTKARAGKTYTFKTGQYAGQTIDIKSQMDGTANYIKDFYKDEAGKPYSPDIDPYYWYRYANNIIQTGRIGDEVKNGVQWDNHQVAPLGREIASYDFFFPYFIAYLYKGVRIFNPGADLFGVQTLVYPALVSAITILLIFLIGRKIAGNTAGFFAAILAGLQSAYVNRTIHGDNDATVVFFAILTLWCFVQAIYSRRAIWQVAFGALAGLSVYLFNLAWGGWWFVFVFIIAAAAVAIGAGIAADIVAARKISIHVIGVAIKKELTEELTGRVGKAALAFVASTILLIGVKNFIMIKNLLFGVATIKTPVLTGSYWPNVLTTVAELNPGSFDQVIGQIGQGVFLLAALAVLLLTTFAIIQFAIPYTSGKANSYKEKIAVIASAIMVAAGVLATVGASIMAGPLPEVKAGQLSLPLWLVAGLGMAAGVGIIFLSLLKFNDKNIKANEQAAHYSIFFATLMMVWFIGTIYASTKGIRFVLLLAPMVGLGFGTALGFFHKAARWVNEELVREKSTMILQGAGYATIVVIEYFIFKNRLMGTMGTLFPGAASIAYWLLFLLILAATSGILWWLAQNAGKGSSTSTAIGALVFLALIIPLAANGPINDAYNIARHDVPIMNDAWHDSLLAIKSDSQPSAIITSWWDFGHHFKAVADRRVTFDGTTQQYPPAHWVGKFFMTKNETEALGILRMLDCGSNLAFDEINKVEADFHTAIDITTRLTTIPSRAQARKALINDYKFTGSQADNVLNYTHCDPPEGYVIASEDMIGKSGVWGHFGSWDFEKGIIWSTLKNSNQKDAVSYMMGTFNYSEAKANQYYNEMRQLRDDGAANSWISPWPSYSGDISSCGTPDSNTMVQCGNGLIVNLTSYDAYFPVQEGKIAHPVSFVYVDSNGNVAEKDYTTDVIPQRLSAILVPQGNSYYAVVSSPEVAAGMYTRMFFLEGTGLAQFKLLSHKQGLTGTNVYVYKALWNST